MSDDARNSSNDSAVCFAASDLLSCDMPQWLDLGAVWSCLSTDQFLAAVRLVVGEDAAKVAAVWAQVVTQLQSSAIQNQLLEEVAARIKSVDKRALLLLQWAPLDMQLTVLKGLDPLAPIPTRDEEWWRQRVPAVNLFVWALYQLDEAGRNRLWDDICPKLDAVHGVLKYRTVRACTRSPRAREFDPGGQVANWLEAKIQPWLTEAGYMHGYIEMGWHGGVSQPYVRTDGCRFVLDRHARYSAFQQGEEVLYASEGRVLVSSRHNKVVAVRFIPVV